MLLDYLRSVSSPIASYAKCLENATGLSAQPVQSDRILRPDAFPETPHSSRHVFNKHVIVAIFLIFALFHTLLIKSNFINNISTVTGCLGFVHSPEFYIQENTTFREVGLFPISGEGRDAPTLLGPLERAKLNEITTVHAFRAIPAAARVCLVTSRSIEVCRYSGGKSK
jgi:hypothetical protein